MPTRSLGLIEAPGTGVDIVTGEGQPLGIPLSFGGPYLGSPAAKPCCAACPAASSAEPKTSTAKPVSALTLQAREQHIRREKASSNIRSNQALMALNATIYMSLGRDGIKEVAYQSFQKAHYMKRELAKVEGVSFPFTGSFFHELVVKIPNARKVLGKMAKKGGAAGIPLDNWFTSLKDCTRRRYRKTHQRRNRQLLQYVRRVYQMAEPLIFDLNKDGRRGWAVGATLRQHLDVPALDLADHIPHAFCARNCRCPHCQNLEVVRHFTRLSRLNHSVDIGFYPLGSCTMKYNPKVNENMARLPGFAHIHPQQPEETVQGALEMLKTLEDQLAEVTGMDAMTLQPAAGAHGEMTGLVDHEGLPQKAGQPHKTKVMIPTAVTAPTRRRARWSATKSSTFKSN